ncbi:hypothetical protein Tco_0590882 [Tanacetum coccineum]
MLERSTGIAGVTKVTLGPEETRTSRSGAASPLRRQGPAGQEQLVPSGGKDQPVKNSEIQSPLRVAEVEFINVNLLKLAFDCDIYAGRKSTINYNAKLSDFGLTKDGPADGQSHVSTRVMDVDDQVADCYLMCLLHRKTIGLI